MRLGEHEVIHGTSEKEGNDGVIAIPDLEGDCYATLLDRVRRTAGGFIAWFVAIFP